ncbi:hypothetical protein QBC35DRAFT_453687 [Podospora australis]|uniref:Uncharacterized protein n=1 Tax=Podospora australis TaxID=1536484 RepID=A0AAN6WTI0_9PEZI|nr:hypothetical protein QBC35DRAFT_453687 [Podospora australis]
MPLVGAPHLFRCPTATQREEFAYIPALLARLQATINDSHKRIEDLKKYDNDNAGFNKEAREIAENLAFELAKGHQEADKTYSNLLCDLKGEVTYTPEEMVEERRIYTEMLEDWRRVYGPEWGYEDTIDFEAMEVNRANGDGLSADTHDGDSSTGGTAGNPSPSKHTAHGVESQMGKGKDKDSGSQASQGHGFVAVEDDMARCHADKNNNTNQSQKGEEQEDSSSQTSQASGTLGEWRVVKNWPASEDGWELGFVDQDGCEHFFKELPDGDEEE